MITVQQIRLLDVFLVAPILIYAGVTYTGNRLIKYSLVIIGVLTLLYNGSNYLKNE